MSLMSRRSLRSLTSPMVPRSPTRSLGSPGSHRSPGSLGSRVSPRSHGSPRSPRSRSYLKVASARPNWIKNRRGLEGFCFCAGLFLWCWPPCFGRIEEESKKTFFPDHHRTQILIILKPRGQKPQSQHDDFQTIVGLTLKFLATRLYYN